MAVDKYIQYSSASEQSLRSENKGRVKVSRIYSSEK